MGHHTSGSTGCQGSTCACKEQVQCDCSEQEQQVCDICQGGDGTEKDKSFEELVLEKLDRIATAIEMSNWIKAFPPAPPVLPNPIPAAPYHPYPYTQPYTDPYTYPGDGTAWPPYRITYENTCKIECGTSG